MRNRQAKHVIDLRVATQMLDQVQGLLEKAAEPALALAVAGLKGKVDAAKRSASYVVSTQSEVVR